MPYIEDGWTDEQKALVMADETLMCVVEGYNKMVELLKTNPESEAFVKTMKFSANHAASVRDYYVRPAVPISIWIKVDADAKKKENVAEEFFKKK
jgi:hypothetical protein